MAAIYRLIPIAISLATVIVATPVQAQTATLAVKARVVAQCTISAKARQSLEALAKRLGRPEILQKCSFGVPSRINRRFVPAATLRPQHPLISRISKKRFIRKTSAGKSDVVLVTVTY
ncbi:MAG: hypothetical protein ACR2Q4_18900 [Geminicoccaceae bacterium]